MLKDATSFRFAAARPEPWRVGVARSQRRIPPIERFLVTCEHGGFRVPSRWRNLFAGREEVLSSHRGYDAGALVFARMLARSLACPLVSSTTTRLLVDLNRSVGHRKVFSESTRTLPPNERTLILDRHYHPYRDQVEDVVRRAIAEGDTVVHVSCHSFTPIWNGQERRIDIGLLHDPKRPLEAARCAAWGKALRQRDPTLRVRRNAPYRGDGDGLTTHLRTRFPPGRYLGFEVEVNQRFVLDDASRGPGLRQDLIHSMATAWALPGAPHPKEHP